MFAITYEPLAIEALTKNLEDSRAGALVTFAGKVRDHNDGCAVLRLEYEVDEILAASEGQKILAAAKQRFGLYECHAVHRAGRLEIGDAAVWVGVISAHRGEAFEACRFVIDEIKHRLPIWKKEHYADGSAEWVNCCHTAQVR